MILHKFLSMFVGKNDTIANEVRKWHEEYVDTNAYSIGKRFAKFKYIIEADPHKILTVHMWGEVNDEFKEKYCFPQRSLGDHCVVCDVRGVYTNDERIFEFNEFGGDHVFVATNNEEDAIMIALRYK